MTPYWAHGIEVDCCEACNNILNRTMQGDRVHNSMDIAEYNVERIITNIETTTSFHFPPERDRYRRYDAY